MRNARFLCRCWWSLGLSLAFLTAGTHSSIAFPVTNFDSVLEAMMLAQSADTEILPRLKFAPGSISFVATIDPAGAFSYATAGATAGATYGGAPLFLSASGTYDPGAHAGSWTSTIDALGIIRRGSGVLAPDIDDPTSGHITYLISPCPEEGSACDWVKFTRSFFIDGLPSRTTIRGSGRDVLTVNGRELGFSSDITAIDPGIDPGDTVWTEAVIVESSPELTGFELVANGIVHSDGNGTFVVTILPAYEPASLVLLGTALAGFRLISRRRRAA